MDFVVDVARHEDFPGILEVQKQAFGIHAPRVNPEPWTRETIEELIEDSGQKTILVARTPEGRILGSVRFAETEGVVFVRKISVNPDLHKQGIGRALIQGLEERVPPNTHKIHLCTLLQTERNIPFFLSMGYRPESVLPDHYHHADILCFGKHLNPSS
ncbi:MAG: GNAT family N-acetyltransferase [Leptospirales bacterium]